jgi:hypothetical protein
LGIEQFLIVSKVSSLGVVVFACGPSPPTNDPIIVEGYLFHPEFDLAGLDLYASLIKAHDQGLVNSEQLLSSICSGSHIIREHRNFEAMLLGHVLVHRVMVRGLLDLTCRSAAHGEATPNEHALMSLKC